MFKDHELIITDSKELLIHDLKKKDSSVHRVKFINIKGEGLLVVGDFGRWSFCREFHPSPDGSVSESYWIEKLQNFSNQKGLVFCHESTETYIDKLLGELDSEDSNLYDYDEEEKTILKGYYGECKEHLHGRDCDYLEFAYGFYMPNFMGTEDVPYVEKIEPYLKCVFEAFNAICLRLKVT